MLVNLLVRIVQCEVNDVVNILCVAKNNTLKYMSYFGEVDKRSYLEWKTTESYESRK